MRAVWVTSAETPATEDDLRSEGVVWESFDIHAFETVAARLAAARRFAKRGEVARSGVNPKDESALAKEADEHAHTADEVRLITEGQAVYDLLALDNARWLRIWLSPGDAIVIPARRYHRMLAPPSSILRYVEVYGEQSGLLPLYRVSA